MNYRLGLIGFPIKHSLSPWIHRQFLEKTNLKGIYNLFEINPMDSFPEKIRTLKDKNIHGFNVTVPYKQAIIPYLDDLDDNAKAIGAVNTVVNNNGRWTGYNTDGIGYLRSLKSDFPDLFSNQNRKILIIGAGGAARGLYHALGTEGFRQIDIANRTLEKAADIAGINNNSTNISILTIRDAQDSLQNYDVIIQTTSVGMRPNENISIMELKQLKPSTIVSDIVYQPILTKFLQEAKARGASIHFGHTMLLYQAQYAFEIWTGIQVPIDNMSQQLNYILEGR